MWIICGYGKEICSWFLLGGSWVFFPFPKNVPVVFNNILLPLQLLGFPSYNCGLYLGKHTLKAILKPVLAGERPSVFWVTGMPLCSFRMSQGRAGWLDAITCLLYTSDAADDTCVV